MFLNTSKLRKSVPIFASVISVLALGASSLGQHTTATNATEGSALARDTASSGDLASYVDQTRNTFNVPGTAVAVVKDGKIVFEQGFGERNRSDGKPVDIHTMFCVASNTKSFTATAMEMLAGEGKLSIDDRVVDHLPWFRMADAYATREMRIRDILAHRSGLGSHAGDLLFVPGTTYSTREVAERLRYLPLTTGFRSTFAYENIMYAVATLVIEQASGESYGDFISKHIFQPVGMIESKIDSTYLKPEDNVATAYLPQEDGRLLAVPPLAWKNNQGAAGIYSSAHDMAKWVQVQLAGGRLPDDGNGNGNGNERGSQQRLFREQNQQRMWSLITPIDIDAEPVPQLQPAQPNFLGYGEGWYLSDYRGRRLVWHTGGFPGMVSQVMLVPSLNLGVVVLTNQESEEAFNAVTMHILDSYMDAPTTDWIEAYAAAAKLGAGQLAEQSVKQAADRIVDATPAHPLIAYTGAYRDSWYGEIDVRRVGGELRMRFMKSPRLIGSLSPWRQDTFLVRWDDRTLNADALIDFTRGQMGRISGARMRRASPRTPHAYDYQDLHLVREHQATEHGTPGGRSALPFIPWRRRTPRQVAHPLRPDFISHALRGNGHLVYAAARICHPVLRDGRRAGSCIYARNSIYPK